MKLPYKYLKKLKWMSDRLDKNLPTIPEKLEEELNTNIFLRCDNLGVKNNLKMTNHSDQEIFNKLRNLKDEF